MSTAPPAGSGGADAAPTGSGGADAAPTGSGGPDAVLDGGLTGSWERLHPLSAVVRAGRGVLTIVIVIGLEAGRNGHDALTAVITVSVALVLGVITWLVTRWRVDDGVLQIETGLLRRQSLRFPLTQIQAVDVVRPGLARVLGMAELRVRMAGARGSSGRLSYLGSAQADVLRARLLALAHGVDEAAPPPPERLLYRVDTGRLVASLLVSAPALWVAGAVTVLIVLAVVHTAALGAALGGSTTGIVAVAGAFWRRFNSGYHLTVAAAPDGLRLRSGLVETSAETIPAGRIQALRLIQPLTWRPFGWCRVEVDIAGRATAGRQNRSAKRAGRTLLPVGTLAQGRELMDLVMPGAPTDRHRPPARVRWKTPLRYRRLSYGLNDRYALTTGGRLRSVTDVVPLARLQSVRRVEGPVQRRLGLASIHLDTAGRAVFAVLRDRDRAEADGLVATLVAASRAARATDVAPGRSRTGPRPAPDAGPGLPATVAVVPATAPAGPPPGVVRQPLPPG